MWLMQDPGKKGARTNTATAKAVKKTEGAVRKWRIAFEWDERARVLGLGADAMAARVYAEKYPGKGPVEVSRIIHLMSVQFVREDGTVPEPVPQPPPEPAIPLERQRDAKAEDARNVAKRRMTLILDAAEGTLAKALQDGKARVNIADLAIVQKLRRDLQDGPTAAQIKDPLATSVRVEEAVKRGADWNEALQEDLEEMGLILGILRTSTEVSNVLPFPGGRPVLEKVASGE